MSRRVLIVEDDQSLAQVLSLSLRKNGYEPRIAADGSEALRLAFQSHPDLVIMDVMLPKMDGWETCRRLKTAANVPVLMVTCRTSEADVVRSFSAGADDYMRKPFTLGEMNARVSALLRRAAPEAPGAGNSVLRVQDITLDLTAHRVMHAGRTVDLTPTEFRLLARFMQSPGRLLTHRELLHDVWGREYTDEKAYLMYYVRFLRRKLHDSATNPRYIVTVRGRGYRLAS